MRKFDYIVIQAPMITDLGLKGNSLLLFAMIHGFSKDGVNRFRANLDEIASWLLTSKSAVSTTLKALEKDGYITRHGEKTKPEYSTNYEELVEFVGEGNTIEKSLVYAKKTPRLLNQEPSQSGVESMVTESRTLLNQERIVTESRTEGVTESVTTPCKYNIINIKYNSSCCSSFTDLSAQEKQEEEKEFFKIFFFRGAANPAAEVKRFIGHNTAAGWQNKAGQPFDTRQKRMGLAELWEFKQGVRSDRDFLAAWDKMYMLLCEAGVEGVQHMLDARVKMQCTADSATLYCTRPCATLLEDNLEKVFHVIKSLINTRKFTYKLL